MPHSMDPIQHVIRPAEIAKSEVQEHGLVAINFGPRLKDLNG